MRTTGGVTAVAGMSMATRSGGGGGAGPSAEGTRRGLAPAAGQEASLAPPQVEKGGFRKYWIQKYLQKDLKIGSRLFIAIQIRGRFETFLPIFYKTPLNRIATNNCDPNKLQKDPGFGPGALSKMFRGRRR